MFHLQSLHRSGGAGAEAEIRRLRPTEEAAEGEAVVEEEAAAEAEFVRFRIRLTRSHCQGELLQLRSAGLPKLNSKSQGLLR